MSQYNHMPPPGAYVPPNQSQHTPPPQGYGAQHQQQGYQQPQGATAGQPSTQGYGQPSQPYKGSGGSFGQMMNQAVTTSKPMLNKLSKTISSKLGSKPSTAGTPQHLQSYQNYQQHTSQQAQTHTQPQSQAFNPHAQQTQHQPQAPNAYPPQQAPPQQPNYSQGQSNHFAQQTTPTTQTPYAQAIPSSQSQQTSYNHAQFTQGGNTVGEQQVQGGQYHQEPMNHAQTQGQYQQQPVQAQYTGQQVGVVGGSQHFQQSNPQSPQIPAVSPQSPAPQQAPWQNSQLGSEQPPVPNHPQQPPATTAHTPSYFPSMNAQAHSNSSQQWMPLSPVGSEGPQHQLPQGSISSPPPPAHSISPVMPSVSPHQSQSSTPAPPPVAANPGPPTAFIAELPADLGSLRIAETKPVQTNSASVPGQTSPYQAYQSSPAQAPSSPGFTIARRAVSISNAPFADPWRFADPLTELPTREFYVIADLLFEAMDRKFEPHNTGMLEASKILRSWVDLTDEVLQLFSYRCYSAFGKLWSLQGIPHVMVPYQPSLMPIWNFDRHSHAQELKLSSVLTHAAVGTTYMPALNRAGWYKLFFLEMMHGPDNINKLLSALCSETYKPRVLHHPDLTKRDKAEAPALQARATEIQNAAINQVCNEIKAAMLAEPDV
ncbi:hypothetical protein C7974DRAFT_384656 [Boeremia exigua]|uniref:uncharacterized protein n=1 Tax=Boeremia exigua TaxID=749465 RepID=UPI001E8E56FE|nr:uncharacterized protein C7974DRAFT_384656 [Boeremia exigua]KAH6641999.1 hypothetical protein C7974DRAFT_384656 [Boeremia exigua]